MLACLLPGCGGGGGSGNSPSLPLPKPTQAKTGHFTVKITVPGSSAATAPRLKRILDVAASTQGILFTVYSSSPASPLAVSGNDISANNTADCTTSGTTRTCTFSLVAPAGTNNLLAQTYDQVIPPSGTVPAGANLLAAGTTSITVTSGDTNASVSLTLNPVVASVQMAATPASLRSLIPATFALAVYAYDAGGNLILAGNYVDQNGNAVSINPSSGNASVTLSTNGSTFASSVSIPGSGTYVTGKYNGEANISPNSAVGATITTTTPAAASDSVTINGPSINVYTITTGSAPSYAAGAIVTAMPSTPPDYQVWWTANQASTSIVGSFDIPTSTVAYQSTQPLTTTGFYDNGFDLLYATSSAPTGLQTLTYPSGTPTGAACSNLAVCQAASGAIRFYSSPLGEPIFGSGNTIYEYSGGGAIISSSTTYPGPAPTPAGMAISGTTVVTADAETSGGGLFSGPVPGTLSAASPQMTSALDVAVDNIGRVYATDPAGSALWIYPPPSGGVLTSGTSKTLTLGRPQYLAYDSDTNAAMWFTENTASGMAIGRYDLATGLIGEDAIGASGGQAGQIMQLPGSATFYVIHYLGTSTPGELLQVTP